MVIFLRSERYEKHTNLNILKPQGFQLFVFPNHELDGVRAIQHLLCQTAEDLHGRQAFYLRTNVDVVLRLSDKFLLVEREAT